MTWIKIRTGGITGSVGDEEAGKGKAGTENAQSDGYEQEEGNKPKQTDHDCWTHIMSDCFKFHPHLPTSLSFRGPYLSMTMPMGRVMADSRKEPTVKARFSISSWSLQMGQPFISRYSSSALAFGEVDALGKLRLELFSRWSRGKDIKCRNF